LGGAREDTQASPREGGNELDQLRHNVKESCESSSDPAAPPSGPDKGSELE